MSKIFLSRSTLGFAISLACLSGMPAAQSGGWDDHRKLSKEKQLGLLHDRSILVNRKLCIQALKERDLKDNNYKDIGEWDKRMKRSATAYAHLMITYYPTANQKWLAGQYEEDMDRAYEGFKSGWLRCNREAMAPFSSFASNLYDKYVKDIPRNAPKQQPKLTAEVSTGDVCGEVGGREICQVKEKGKDIYGLPKPMGWFYYSIPSGKLFYSRLPQKVNVRGTTDRYFEKKMIVRYYSSGKAGTPARITQSGTAQTNCTGYGSMVSCTTTPAKIRTWGGSPAEMPGVKQEIFSTIIDCKDKTYANYEESEWGEVTQIQSWKPVQAAKLKKDMKAICGEKIKTLELSSFSKYAE